MVLPGLLQHLFVKVVPDGLIAERGNHRRGGSVIAADIDGYPFSGGQQAPNHLQPLAIIGARIIRQAAPPLCS